MFDALVMIVYLGWPGMVVGGASGALILRRRKLWWALFLAAVGLIACIWIRLAMAF